MFNCTSKEFIHIVRPRLITGELRLSKQIKRDKNGMQQEKPTSRTATSCSSSPSVFPGIDRKRMTLN